MAKENKPKKHFFKDFKAELKKVIWPTPKQVVKNTIAVIVMVLITAVIVFVLDFAFDMLNNYGINKIKSGIKEKENSIETNVIYENTIIEDENIANSSEKNKMTEGNEESIEDNE